MNKWYDTCKYLHNIPIDYRNKSIQSAMCTLCDNYEDILALQTCKGIRVADLSNGESKDDGYRGVHVYFQLSSFHYPIEIQYNTYYKKQGQFLIIGCTAQRSRLLSEVKGTSDKLYYDRQINKWLHKYPKIPA